MKKTLLYFSALLLAVLVTTGCNKNEDSENYLKYAGKTHAIKEAGQIFYGHYFSTKANNLSLVFLTAEHAVIIEMFVPNSSNKLVAGTYEADDSFEAFTMSEGSILKISDKSTIYEIIDGRITIRLEGNVYTIDMEGTLHNNTSITGKYTGQIIWEDGDDD